MTTKKEDKLEEKNKELEDELDEVLQDEVSELTNLTQKIETLEADLLEADSLKLRALADLQNFQRRESENKKQWTDMAVSGFLQKVLPNFLELGLGASHSSDEEMKKVVNKFFTDLAKNGLQKIEPKAGDSIDPHIHEVLMAGEGESGTVISVLESGWKFGERVIAPAKISGAQ